MAEKKSFLGTGWSFPPTFDKSTGVSMVSDADDIRQSLIILLSTEKGDRFLNPEYGCELRQFMFAEITTTFETEMKNAIFEAIREFEPRIILENVDLNLDDVIEGVVYISLNYFVRTINVRENLVYPFYTAADNNLNPASEV